MNTLFIKYLFPIITSVFMVLFGNRTKYHYEKWQDSEREEKEFDNDKRKCRIYSFFFLLSMLVTLIAIFFLTNQSEKIYEDIYIEDFGSKSNWGDKSMKEKSIAKVLNGRLFLSSKNNRTQSRHKFVDSFNTDIDYSIRTSIQFGDGNTEKFYGIDWGVNVTGNHLFNFGISPEKKVIIYKYTQEEGKEELFISKPLDIIDRERFNILEIEKVGNEHIFKINTKEVTRLKNLKEFGEKVGFSVPARSEIVIDFLRIGYVKMQPI